MSFDRNQIFTLHDIMLTSNAITRHCKKRRTHVGEAHPQSPPSPQYCNPKQCQPTTTRLHPSLYSLFFKSCSILLTIHNFRAKELYMYVVFYIFRNYKGRKMHGQVCCLWCSHTERTKAAKREHPEVTCRRASSTSDQAATDFVC
jgi:hypothetical protein